jgi:transposase, IS5 family
MTQQITFAQAEFTAKKKATRREQFLARMEEVIPWERLLAVIAPHYPKGERGRPPMGLERMLRVYFLQQWYALADEALEDALYDSQALQRFARIELGAEGVPDATTLLKFRRLLEKHDLCKGLFAAINADLAARGLLLREGTLVDATLIAAPASTKNKKRERDPQMHQTRKGNQWYFGMKAHIGADRDSKLVHTVIATAANVADVTQTAALLHGEESQVHADACYTGVQKRPEIIALERPIDWQIHPTGKARSHGILSSADSPEGPARRPGRTLLPCFRPDDFESLPLPVCNALERKKRHTVRYRDRPCWARNSRAAPVRPNFAPDRRRRE